MMRDWLTVSAQRHSVHGLIEVDVTQARRALGETSFTAFLLHCYAVALSHEPRLNAIRRGRRLYVFPTVNVGTMVEVGDDGARRLAGMVVRDADAKTVRQIHEEIRAAQRRSVEDLAVAAGMSAFFALPRAARRLALRAMLARPQWVHDRGLVAGVTAIGMFGDGPGWGLPLSVGAAATTCVTVGGIGRRPVLSDAGIEEHEFVCLTLSFDHDLIDGAPAARFSAELCRLVEAADGVLGDEPDGVLRDEPDGAIRHGQGLSR